MDQAIHLWTGDWPCSGCAVFLSRVCCTPVLVRQVCSTRPVAPSHHGVECQPSPLACEVLTPVDLLVLKNLVPLFLLVLVVCFGQGEYLPDLVHRLFSCWNRLGSAFWWRRNVLYLIHSIWTCAIQTHTDAQVLTTCCFSDVQCTSLCALSVSSPSSHQWGDWAHSESCWCVCA